MSPAFLVGVTKHTKRECSVLDRKMKEHFVLVNVFDTKFVIWIHVRKMSQAFVHSSARNLIMKHIVISNIRGCHTLIVVSKFKFMQTFPASFHFNQFSDDPCELYCTDSEDTLIVPWGDSAADGTPCNIGTNDMCISGICRVSISTSESQSNKTTFSFWYRFAESWL